MFMILSLHGKYEQAHISSLRFYYIMVYMVGVNSYYVGFDIENSS